MHNLPLLTSWLACSAILLCTPPTPCPAEPQTNPHHPLPPSGLLSLNDGSWLRGRLLNINDKQDITWEHDASGAKLTFPLTAAKQIHLSTNPPHPSASDTVRIINGTFLKGKVETFDGANLTLTSFGNQITIPREIISGFLFHHHSINKETVLFNSIKPLSAWKYSNNPNPEFWSIPNEDALIYNGETSEFISREVALPMTATISFDLSWKTHLNTHFFMGQEVSPLPDTSRNYYRIGLSNRMVHCSRETRNGETNTTIPIGSSDISEILQDLNSANFTISLDRNQRLISLHINGELVDAWKDEQNGETPAGGSIQFYGYHPYPVLIRNLIIREWDGLVHHTNIDPTKASIAINHDLISLINNTNIPKPLASIVKNESGERLLSIHTPNSRDQQTTFPANQVAQIIFAQSKQIHPDKFATNFNPHATFSLVDGSKLDARNITFINDSFHFQVFDNQNAFTIRHEDILEISFLPEN